MLSDILDFASRLFWSAVWIILVLGVAWFVLNQVKRRVPALAGVAQGVENFADPD